MQKIYRERGAGEAFRAKLERRITEHAQRTYEQTHAPDWVIHRRINGRDIINRRHQTQRRWTK